MFGIEDGGIILVHILCVLAVLLCLVYGAINWNRGAEHEPEQIAEEAGWQKQEDAIDETL